MARDINLLNDIQIATPCPAKWEDMTGDDRTRFCGQCNLHVYNIVSMTGPEAETLIRQTEGRLCVRLHRRADGTVLTRDCPVGIGGACSGFAAKAGVSKPPSMTSDIRKARNGRRGAGIARVEFMAAFLSVGQMAMGGTR